MIYVSRLARADLFPIMIIMKSKHLLHLVQQSIAVTIATLLLISHSSSVFGQSVQRKLSDEGTWQITEQPETGTPEHEIYMARKALANKDYSDARKRADAFIDAHPQHILVGDAMLIRGECLQATENYYKALYDYESVAVGYPGSESFTIALEREYEIAEIFAAGKRRKLWGMRLLSAKEEAAELFIRIQERLPGSQLAQKAGKALADFYFNERDLALAVIAYDLYIENFPRAEDRERAMERIVHANLAKSKGAEFDPSGLYEARAWIDMIENRFPAESEQMGADALRSRIDESDANRMLYDAKWYFDQDDYVSTRFVLKKLLRKYPATVAAQNGYLVMVDQGWVAAPATTPAEIASQPEVEITQPEAGVSQSEESASQLETAITPPNEPDAQPEQAEAPPDQQSTTESITEVDVP